VFDLAGWIGRNGTVPGYQTAVFYLPEKQTTMVVFTNSDIAYQGLDTSAVLATAITSVISPTTCTSWNRTDGSAKPAPPPDVAGKYSTGS
jgi:D-alanyl-D-alanine carboxypeptidase